MVTISQAVATAINNTPISMSSLEIAELTGKRHDNVMADIRVMLTELHGEEGLLKFQASYINSQNKEQPCFKLPKRESLILVSGYNITMRAKIIDRWQQLEGRATLAPPLNPANISRMDLIKIAMQAEQERLVLEAKVEVLAPKAAIFDRIADADGAMGLQAAAKALQQSPNKFCDWLRKNHWIYRRAGGKNNLVLRQSLIDEYRVVLFPARIIGCILQQQEFQWKSTVLR